MNKKKIKILTSGIIRVKGYICGPVLTPYYESTDVIYRMLAQGIKIVEVLDDGSEVKLTVSNLNKESNVNLNKPNGDAVKPADTKVKIVKETVELTDTANTVVCDNADANTDSTEIKSTDEVVETVNDEESEASIEAGSDDEDESTQTASELTKSDEVPRYNKYNKHNKNNKHNH